MYKHILVPVDIGHPNVSEKALAAAPQIAQTDDAVLHVLGVVAPLDSFTSTFFPKRFQEQASNAAQRALHAFTETADLAQIQVQHIVAHGAIYDQILTIAKQVDADLIVVASHRPELGDYLLGPNAAKVVRHAQCSVMVVRD